ncbi:MAG: Tripartite tricarboxylate transporter TctB family [Deltaproteobacteria bacterium]|nr:Tripartite tricarboxylate transporter TctB family [Deltaproteobacteria bacterium]
MRRANITVALALVSASAFLLFEAGRFNFGTLRVPQTGFFPKTLVTLLLLLSLVLLVQALRRKETERGSEKIAADGWTRIAATLATMIGFALVLEWLGFLLSTFVLMVLLLRAIEAPRWSKVFTVALVTALAVYGLFAWLLSVPLPAGVLGF